MRNLRIKTWLTALAGLAAAGVLWLGGRAGAQPSMMGTANNFSMNEYFAAPHDTQMKTMMSGKQAQPQPDGKYFIKGLRLVTYNEAGRRESVVLADDCVYDAKQRMASSAGPLRVETSDGNFIVTGEGFTWLQDDSKLYISNRVHTTIYHTGVMTK